MLGSKTCALGLMACAVLGFGGCTIGDGSEAPTGDSQSLHVYATRTRTYYIAADEVPWNYAPDGKNVVAGRAFDDDENVFVKGNGDTRIGSTYQKAIYREYTDATFKKRKARCKPGLPRFWGSPMRAST